MSECASALRRAHAYICQHLSELHAAEQLRGTPSGTRYQAVWLVEIHLQLVACVARFVGTASYLLREISYRAHGDTTLA